MYLHFLFSEGTRSSKNERAMMWKVVSCLAVAVLGCVVVGGGGVAVTEAWLDEEARGFGELPPNMVELIKRFKVNELGIRNSDHPAADAKLPPVVFIPGLTSSALHAILKDSPSKFGCQTDGT